MLYLHAQQGDPSNPDAVLIAENDSRTSGFMFDRIEKKRSVSRQLDAFIKFGYWEAPQITMTLLELEEARTSPIV